MLKHTMLAPDQSRQPAAPTVTLATRKGGQCRLPDGARQRPGGCGGMTDGIHLGPSESEALMAQSPPAKLPIDVISDVVCPWCFIGKKRIEQAIALKPDIPVELRFHPYFLNDWIPREGISREDYLIKKFGSVERYGRSPNAWTRPRPTKAWSMRPTRSAASPTRPIATA